MKKETQQPKIQKEKQKKQQPEQPASDNRITNPTILRKYGLSESVNPQMLME